MKNLPPDAGFESAAIYKALARANRALAELKGLSAALPNQEILIDTLTLQEARASSGIENIVTTQDELFQGDLAHSEPKNAAVKEVLRYSAAIKLGYAEMMKAQGLITNNTLIGMFRLLLSRENEGFRATPGTVLKNEATGEIVHRPPQDANEIVALMSALERFINDDKLCALDPLIKMALIHHQFESIHPFSDGNGRIGRILNVLYLVHAELLKAPVLYLSRRINQTKADYYRLLQGVRSSDNTEAAWREWVTYMLTAVAETAHTSLILAEGIRAQMENVQRRLQSTCPDIYSHELLSNLFRHPYTKIEHVTRDVQVSRKTAGKYLAELSQRGIVRMERIGRTNYYINENLVQLLTDVSGN